MQIDAGETSSAAVSDEGDVYTWGWGGSWMSGNGGLGHGNTLTQPRPALVETLSDAGVKMSHVAVGSNFMYGLSSSGKVFSWGHGELGRLGNGKGEQKVPEPIELLADKKIVSLAAGRDFGLAVSSDGRVWGWGKNDAGQLGIGGGVLMDLNTMEEYPLEVALEGDEAPAFNGQIVSVAAAGNHSIALTRDGRVYQWGGRTFLQPQLVEYGYSTEKDAEEEEKGGKDKGDKAPGVKISAVEVAAGEGVLGLIQETGDVYTWGKNRNTSMLGNSPYSGGTRRPTRVAALHKAGKVGQLSFGTKHAAAIMSAAAPTRPTLS